VVRVAISQALLHRIDEAVNKLLVRFPIKNCFRWTQFTRQMNQRYSAGRRPFVRPLVADTCQPQLQPRIWHSAGRLMGRLPVADLPASVVPRSNC
jgi:hypothetical protein